MLPAEVVLVKSLSHYFDPSVDVRFIDPPILIPDESTILTRSMSVAGRLFSASPRINFIDQTYDLWVAVDENQFPNVQDFVEWVGVHGWEAYVPLDLDAHLLGSGSLVHFAHSRAVLQHPGDYYAGWNEPGTPRPVPLCPRGKKEHEHLPFGMAEFGAQMCAQLYKQDVQGGNPVRGHERFVNRTIGAWNDADQSLDAISYFAWAPPRGANMSAKRGFFLSLPIHITERVFIDPEEYLDEYDDYETSQG